MSIHQLEKKFKTTDESIKKVLEKFNIKQRLGIWRLNQFQEEEIVFLYEKKRISLYQLISQFHTSYESIIKILKNSKVEFRNLSQAMQRYKINEKYFDKIDSIDKAYFLGLLYTDGCNFRSKKEKTVTVNLQEGDRKILETFRKYLETDRPLSYLQFPKKKNYQPQFRLTINNQYLSNQLNKLGCVPRKASKLKFPFWLEKNLVPHFIRGVFAGDGCISFSYLEGKYYRRIRGEVLFISSSLNFLKSLAKIFICEVQIKGHFHKHKSTGVYTLKINGNKNVDRIMQWLHNSKNDLFLERKFIKWKQFQQESQKTEVLHRKVQDECLKFGRIPRIDQNRMRMKLEKTIRQTLKK